MSEQSGISAEMMAKIAAAKEKMAQTKPPAAEPVAQAKYGPVVRQEGSNVTSRAIYIPGAKHERGGLVTSIVLSMGFMILAWLLNGATNVVGAAIPLYYVIKLINGIMHVVSRFTGDPWTDWQIGMGSILICGVLLHLFMSTVEQYLWRTRVRMFFPIIVLVGTVDVLLAALAIMFLFNFRFVFWDSTLATGIAMVVALVPEPVFFRLWRVLQAYQSTRG